MKWTNSVLSGTQTPRASFAVFLCQLFSEGKDFMTFIHQLCIAFAQGRFFKKIILCWIKSTNDKDVRMYILSAMLAFSLAIKSKLKQS